MGGEEGIRRFLAEAGRQLEALYYPPYCAVCDQAVEPPLPSPFICRCCLADLPFRMDREAVAWQGPCPLYASFYYREPLPKLIVSLKFSDRTDRARLLGPLMAGTVVRNQCRADAIIPVPLHEKRRKERGYNQVELLAKALSPVIQVPLVSKLLLRRVHTGRQSEASSVKERQIHMRGAFEVDGGHPALEALTGRPVLLLDDVLTTGATLSEAARTLQACGLEVTGLVVASHKDPYRPYGQALDRFYG